MRAASCVGPTETFGFHNPSPQGGPGCSVVPATPTGKTTSWPPHPRCDTSPATASSFSVHSTPPRPNLSSLTDQAAQWAGRPLTAEDIERRADAVQHSSIPEAIDTIVSSWDD